MKEEAGFTLLELLIAITISGVILGVVFIFLDQSISIWERSDMNNKWEQDWRVLESKLGKDLQSIFISTLYQNNCFRGDYQEIEWLIIEDDEIKKVRYYLDYYNNQYVRELSTIEGKENNKEMKLNFFTNLEIKGVEYFFYEPKDKYWQNNWDYQEKGYLPSVLKVSFTGEDQQFPPLILDIYIGKIY